MREGEDYRTLIYLIVRKMYKYFCESNSTQVYRESFAETHRHRNRRSRGTWRGVPCDRSWMTEWRRSPSWTLVGSCSLRGPLASSIRSFHNTRFANHCRIPPVDKNDKNDKQKKTKETDDPAGRRPSSRSPLANSVFVSAISIPLSHVATNTLSLFF